MNKQRTQSVTALPQSPDEERRSRMIKYSVAMALRLACFIVAALLPKSWWTLVPLLAALILPYIAVVIANAIVQTPTTVVERPGNMVPVSLPRNRGTGE